VTKWKWIAASRKGTSHERSNTPRQDAFRIVEARHGRLIAVVSDGAGSASYSRYGAVLTCRILSTRALAHGKFPDHLLLEEWIDEVRDTLAMVAVHRDLTMRDFACTMLFAMADSERFLTAHVGDGAIVRQKEVGGEWQCVSWPESGEYASTTFFVTDDLGARLRVATFEEPTNAVALFSDGIERLVLDFTNLTAPPGFFNTMSGTMSGKDAGNQRRLSAQLGDYLGSPKINDRTDDDKTLVVAVRR
jgi:hypothetical protein